MKRKLEISGYGCVTQDVMLQNLKSCKSRGLPEASRKARPPLAVVGGGHSAASHVEELKRWPGDIWASGSVFHWLRGLGIDSTAFCVDPQPALAGMVAGASKAILATSCDPSAFDALRDASVEVFDLIRDGVGVNHGPTTGTAAFDLAITVMGYTDVSFFGFDSCYVEEEVQERPELYSLECRTHAYKTEPDPTMLRVVTNGRAFITGAEFFMQAQWMAELFRSEIGRTGIIKNRSAGLLKALIEDPDYDCTHTAVGMFKEAA